MKAFQAILLGLALGAAAPPAREPDAQAVGAAFARVVGLPGQVSLAAASLDEAGPRYFLTQKAGRPLATGAGTSTAQEVVEEIAAIRKSGKRASLRADAGPFRAIARGFRFFAWSSASGAGAQSMRFLLRNGRGRWIALAVIWNGESADEAILAARVAPLLALIREG